MATREAQNLSALFANEGATYLKIIGGFTVPVVKRFKEGDTLDAISAQALNTHFYERAASVANSNLDRGSWKDLSDDEKVAKATQYMIDYKYGADIGSETFGASLLETAADRIIAADNAEMFVNVKPTEARKAREPYVAQMLSDPSLTEKYADRVRTVMAEILAERHERTERKASVKPSELKISL